MLSKLRQQLINSGVLTPAQLAIAEKIDKQKGKGLLLTLLDMNDVAHDALLHAIAAIYGAPYIDISNLKVDAALLEMCPENLCLEYQFLPVSTNEHELVIATGDPLNVIMLDDLAFRFDRRIIASFTRPDLILQKIATIYQDDGAAFEEMEGDSVQIQEFEDSPEVTNLDELKRGAEDSPIIKLVNRIISQAIKVESSDIHIEAGEHQSVVRMRIDGLLKDMMKFPFKAHTLVVSCIKIMARLDISNSRTPQDGRFQVKLWGKKYDMRISTLPSMHGEKIVLRILDKSGLALGLNVLGFEKTAYEHICECIKLSTGAVLVTGPTGSGKTTTLYSFLHSIRNETLNMITVEDPIEYQIERVNQVPVNTKTGMTFAKALRSILRQDPDVVMVGEIRDHETASIAMHAAQTGHLVLSTLHTNDAPSTISRLLDIGVESSVIASSLNLIVAQRLVRRLCPKCKLQSLPDEKLRKRFDIPNGISFYEKSGCNDCMDTGYKGRLAIFEVLYVNNQIRKLIAEGADQQMLMQAAREADMLTLFEDGFNKALAGHTSLDEVERLCTVPKSFSMREQMDEQQQLLPYGSAQRSQNQIPVQQAGEADQQTILIVDDSSDLRLYVEVILKGYGYNVSQAEDGQQAWEMLQTMRPSLVLLDVEMPKMSGLELLQKIRDDKSFNDMPVVMLTSHKGEEQEVLGLETGADDYIGKPVEPLKLQARIKRTLALYNHLQSV
jgi:type IV pilus assembly protein PilB